MENYGDFRDLEHLYDARIITEDGSVFPVHRILVAIRSQYFHNLLCVEGLEDTDIPISGVSSATMKIVIDYLNTGYLKMVEERDIPDVLSASFFFGIEELFQACRASASRSFTTSNCIPLFLTSLNIEDWEFAKACIRFIVVHFERVLKDPNSRFQDIPIEPFERFLSLDSLNVSSEYIVWLAIAFWVSKDPSLRKIYIIDLLPYVRVPVGRCDLAPEILNHAHVQENPCFNHIKEIINHRSLNFKHRIPEEIFFFTKSFMSFADYSEGVKVYITYDEDIDFWRNIGTKTSFCPDVVLHGYGPLIVLFDTALNTSFTFNMISKNWVPLNPPTATRKEYNVVKLGRFVYVLGGLIPGEDFDVSTSVERYDFESDLWESMEPHYAISQGAAEVIGNSICIIGTVSGFFSETIIAQSYNPNTETWSAFSPPNTYRRMFAFVAYRNQLYVLGGHSSEGFLTSVEVYDAKRNIWSEFEALPFSYFLPKAVVIKDVLYVYDSHDDDLQEFRCPPVRWDAFSRQWQVVEASSPYCDLHLYHFCAINDPEAILQMRTENRDPVTEWKGSPFLNHA